MEKNKKQLIKLIADYGPCDEARDWLGSRTPEKAFNDCEDYMWIIWLWDISQTERGRHGVANIKRGIDTLLTMYECIDADIEKYTGSSKEEYISASLGDDKSIMAEAFEKLVHSYMSPLFSIIAYDDTEHILDEDERERVQDDYHSKLLLKVKEMLPLEVWKF